MESKKLKKLVKLAVKRDSGAQQELYLDSYRSVYYLALKMLKNESSAEDIVQETFISAFSNVANLKNPDSWHSWVNTIAANKCRNEIRKKNPMLLDESENEQFFGEETSTGFIPEKALDSRENQKIILNIIDNLPTTQKMCLMLHYYQQFQITQIAQIMECSEGTVKSRLFAAREKIRTEVERIEKRDGVKLYAVPIFTLLAAEASGMFIPQTVHAAMWSGISQSIMGTGAATISKGAINMGIKQAMGRGAAGKIIAAVCATAIVATGATVIPKIISKPKVSEEINSIYDKFTNRVNYRMQESELPKAESYDDLFGRILEGEYEDIYYANAPLGFFVDPYYGNEDETVFTSTWAKEDKKLFESGKPFIDRPIFEAAHKNKSGNDGTKLNGTFLIGRVSRLSDYAALIGIPDANEEDIMQYKYGHLEDGGYYHPWSSYNVQTYEFKDKVSDRNMFTNTDPNTHEYYGYTVNGYYVEFEYLYVPDYNASVSYNVIPEFIWQREELPEKDIYR